MRQEIRRIIEDNLSAHGLDLQDNIIHNIATDMIVEIDDYVDIQTTDSYDNGRAEAMTNIEYDLKAGEYGDNYTALALQLLKGGIPSLSDVMKMEWILENWDNIKEENFIKNAEVREEKAYDEGFEVGYTTGYSDAEDENESIEYDNDVDEF